MNISAPFIKRSVATSLLSAALLLTGAVAYRLLPEAPLPELALPTIQASAALPGASTASMASSVATPLERQFGRIAGVTEMSSTSQLGSTQIVLQFDLSRNIDAAARDVQAAINAARGQLPSNLPNSPIYRKINPADAPIMIMAATSETMPLGRIYDAADSILAQKLSQVKGVGQVTVGGGARPAVRVDVNPMALAHYGIGLDDVRFALRAANANVPKGELADQTGRWVITATDQLSKANQYRPLIVAYRKGAPVRLSDVAEVSESVEDVRTAGLANGKPAVLLIIFRQPGANIIATVDRVRALLPQLRASILGAVDLSVVLDRTTTIRASIADVEVTLLIAIALVVLVVFVFLRNAWATAIPGVVVPLSLIGTFGVMYLMGYSIDNLSLMALTISTGFVVDDAIVVIENITRHLEHGLRPVAAALRGAREVGFTVLSMSTSLVAVFLPILLMGGIVGRLFREFAVVLSVAVAVSLVVSLTTTPMMCAQFLKPRQESAHGRLYRVSERAFGWLLRRYEASLSWVLRHARLTMVVAAITVCINVYLYAVVPKGFFPEQDNGVGGRLSNALFQFTLQGDDLRELNRWAPRMQRKLQTLPSLTDVSSDQQNRGLEASVVIDRDTASRLGITPQMIDDTLYDAFGQRQVSTMYTQLNQYHVVMEVAPRFWQNPETLQDIYVRAASGAQVPLSAFTHFAPTTTALAVNHQGQFPAVTLSFNLAPGVALGDAVTAIETAEREIGLPASIRAGFQGTAQAFQASLANEPLLILAALVTVSIVLGVPCRSRSAPGRGPSCAIRSASPSWAGSS